MMKTTACALQVRPGISEHSASCCLSIIHMHNWRHTSRNEKNFNSDINLPIPFSKCYFAISCDVDRLLIAARRPPVEETTSFLDSLLASHGPNYLEKLFGSRARHKLRDLGGVNAVAIALSGKESN